MKYCVLPLTGTDNTDADCDIIFTMKDKYDKRKCKP